MRMRDFGAMVARLERQSAARPTAYVIRVALLAALGFALMLLIVLMAGAGLALLAALAVILLLKGGAGAVMVLFKFGKLMLLAALPLWVLVRSSANAVFLQLPAPKGDEVTRDQAPALFAAIDRVRARLGGPRVHHVLVVDSVNAAVMQRPRFGLVGFARNYLLLGLPLLESTTPDEALAIVAHEYGHLAGSHGRFAALIYRLRLSWTTIQVLASHWQGALGGVLGRAVRWYVPYFNAYTFVLARANEYAADRAAVDVVGAASVAGALRRTEIAAVQYSAFIAETLRGIVTNPVPPADVASRWGAAAAKTPPAAPYWLEAALDRAGELGDTHPTLRARLDALRVRPDAPDSWAVDRGRSAAQVWFAEILPRLRDASAARWTDSISKPWTQQLEHMRAGRERLARLRAQGERTVAEDAERLHLQAVLEPDTATCDELAAFNAEHADVCATLYLEGRIRLDRGDERGVALLERAMDLDPDAIKAGCEVVRAFYWARDDGAAAKPYDERWKEQRRIELARLEQAREFDVDHPVAPAVLAEEAIEVFRARLRGLDRTGIAALYLVRRVLPAGPALPTYVLAFEAARAAKILGRRDTIGRRLAAMPWPVHLLICDLDAQPASYAQRVKAVPGSRLL